ncbi:MAG: polyprenyl synthetase family protein [Lentisphaeria bacterium]|nr:polyprenyl synthetase family protein [Lentisphaeria bacterium]
MMTSRARVSDRIDEMIQAETLPGTVLPDYLGRAMAAYPASGGKRLRPALLVWCCEAAGGDVDQAWDAALAVELYHNWTLIHDDIIDHDSIRRGAPTCHVVLAEEGRRLPGASEQRRRTFGANMAILAGDVLHGWSVDCLARSVERGVAPEVVLTLIRRMSHWLTPGLISGEALDVTFELRDDVSPEDIRRMMFLKTGALLQFAAEAGVMIGRGAADTTHEQVVNAGKFAAEAGVAFQIKDDLLGVFADEKKLGKPVGSDISEGKRTLLLTRTMTMASPSQLDPLRALLGCGRPLTQDELRRCQNVIIDCGAQAVLQAEADGVAESAEKHLAAAFPPSPARENLQEWLAFLTRRDF